MAKRNDLNGLCLRKPGHAEIYLILNGERRLIPDPRTFELLFRPGTPIIPDINIDEIDDGDPPVNGACLLRVEGPGSREIYLFPGGEQKMEIPSTQAMDQYNFDHNKVVSLPGVAVDAIPNGPNVAARD